MERMALAVLLGLASACHLAPDPDPVACATGTHDANGFCVPDKVDALTIVINAPEGGAECSVTPTSLTVPNGQSFSFQNDDASDHVVRGADGQTWATIPAGQLGPYVELTKIGSFAYTVSGCDNGGTIVVE